MQISMGNDNEYSLSTLTISTKTIRTKQKYTSFSNADEVKSK